jgi:hypothetical protein
MVLLSLVLSHAFLATNAYCQPTAAGRSFAIIDTEWQRTLTAVEKYLENPQPAA